MAINSSNNKKFNPYLKNPLILALDLDNQKEAMDLVHTLKDIVGGFKLGPRFVYRFGSEGVKRISELAPVFVDCKFFDIPSTMEAAVKACFDSGASLVTVHALAGASCLRQLSHLESELNQQRPFKILCVTILTSWEENQLPPSLKDQPISSHVHDLAQMSLNSGLTGVVCSPEELSLFHNTSSPQFSQLFLVTPGVRLPLHESHDQKRVMTPNESIKLGASAFVVGRPILNSKNIRETAMDYAISMYDGQ